METTIDALLNRRITVEQPKKGFRVAVDTILLAAAVGGMTGQKAIDLGCGVGGAMLAVGVRVHGLVMHGLEIQPEIADLARANIKRNNYENRMEVTTGDVTQLPGPMLFTYDHVMMNPPFHDPAQSDPSPDAAKATATHGSMEELEMWVISAARCLKTSGVLTMISRYDRLKEILGYMKPHFGDAEVIPLLPKPDEAAKRFILRARKGADAAHIPCRPMTLHRSSGGYTDEIEAVLKHNHPISFMKVNPSLMRLIVLLVVLLALAPSLALAKTKHVAHVPAILIPTIPPVVVTYDVYVGGVHLMSADVFFEEQGDHYRARVLGHSVGIWHRLFPWDTELKVEGKIRGDQFVPAEFYTRDVWGHKARTTWLHFLKNADVKPDFDPPNTDKNREEITFEQRRGSLDPITGLLQLLAYVAVHKSCATTVPIFEGKRRFDITGIDVGTENIDEGDYSAFKGDARTCDASFDMVAGEWKDRAPDRFWTRDGKEAGREPFHIWLGALSDTLPEMPVRLESGSVWGLIIMHLSAWHYATAEEMKY